MLRRMEELCDAVLARLDLSGGGRRLVALSGAPGSGKSTLSEPLAAMLTERGVRSEVVPMDGFHLDNRLLEARGLMPRKGAPETFDLGGFKRLCHALRADDEVIYPLFDRSRDLAIAGAAHVGQDCSIAVIEGNYLLFDEPGWRELADLWDVSIRLDVPLADLEARLVQRWLTHGLDQAAAEARARGNDLANAERIASARLPADLTWR
ncbi:nucleoside triphosphate hydrolase [Tritonibacter scottomollicae]|uniref:Fructokinase n=1 Tax=Tritonibacter scottomollicae TaxID=483013 RepID=A0A2T1AG97_TRISK|nr:nucleoside triphosphate hydrolase [Tritonibacter scottomollicae]PRZ47623.1 fructokinase [Tritonibacter scottomollicae]